MNTNVQSLYMKVARDEIKPIKTSNKDYNRKYLSWIGSESKSIKWMKNLSKVIFKHLLVITELSLSQTHSCFFMIIVMETHVRKYVVIILASFHAEAIPERGFCFGISWMPLWRVLTWIVCVGRHLRDNRNFSGIH